MKKKQFIIISIVGIGAFLLALLVYLQQDENKAIGYLKFQTKSISGETIDENIFENYRLTMINIWGTFCDPCSEEMSKIQELYEELLPSNVNVIGILSDTTYPISDQEVVEQAKSILEDSGITYTNILPDTMLQSKLLNRIIGVPSTVFVNQKGEVIGKIVEGPHTKGEYQRLIEEILEEKLK